MKIKPIIIILLISFTAVAQSVTITPLSDTTANHPREFFSGTAQIVLNLRNNQTYTMLNLRNNSGYSRGSLSGSEDALVIWHPGGDITLQNKYSPDQFVKLHANGNFGVGNITTPSAGLHVKNYSKLGEDAPAVKMKKFTGTTPAFQGSCVTIPLGSISAEKVLDYKAFVNYGTTPSNVVSEEYSLNPNYKFSTYLESSGISICLHTGNSSLITNKSFKVLVTYEE